MRAPISRETAEFRVVNKYHKLYEPLIDLVNALQLIEPGGTLIDNVTLTEKSTESKVEIAYTARPVMLTIKDKDRTFILRVIEERNGQRLDRRAQTP